MKRLKVIVVEEEVSPKFVVPHSNFGTGSGNPAYLIGIPCEVLSEPYLTRRDGKTEKVIDVKSCVTGLTYTIPEGWSEEFDTLTEANKVSHLTGYDDPMLTDIIGAYYWPKDNSYIKNFNDEGDSLFHKTCEILSVPFKDETEYGEREFVLVAYKGKVYRTLWEEWCLYPA